MKRVLLLLFVFSIVLSGCEKDIVFDSIEGKWEVISLYKNQSYNTEADFNYTIEFKKNGSVLLELDANYCESKYSTSCDDCISFEGFGCTKKCCDSDYALKLKSVIEESKHYSIDGDILTLNNVGEVKLKWLGR